MNNAAIFYEKKPHILKIIYNLTIQNEEQSLLFLTLILHDFSSCSQFFKVNYT